MRSSAPSEEPRRRATLVRVDGSDDGALRGDPGAIGTRRKCDDPIPGPVADGPRVLPVRGPLATQLPHTALAARFNRSTVSRW